MRRWRAILWGVVWLGGWAGGGVFGCGPPFFTAGTSVVTENDHQLKAGSPKVDVVYFMDLQCPACRKFMEEEYPRIKKEYVESTKIRWVVRHRPIPEIHERAIPAAEAAECAAEQGKFFEYIEGVFKKQEDLSRESLVKQASDLGLEVGKFEACVDQRKYESKVKIQMADADQGKVTFTPAFVSGMRGTNRSGLRALIEDALKK